MRYLFLSFLFFVAAPVLAVPVQWTFQDVVFDDGATLTGSFIFDEDSDTVKILYDSWYQTFYTDIQIETGLPGNGEPENLDNYLFYDGAGLFEGWFGEYGESLAYNTQPEPLPSDGPFRVQDGILLATSQTSGYCISSDNYYCDRYLDLDFSSSLTNAGGIVSVTGSETVDGFFYGGYGFNTRSIVSGTLVGTVVPLPPAVWLFGSGLGLLGWFRRRQTA